MAVLDRLSMPLACLITTAVLAGGCGTRPGSGDEGAEDGEARGAIAEGTPTGIRYLRGEEGDRFARATAPREFRFPEDHGAHPEFRAEWWYFTGNVFSAEGRHYGFELTFFRYALDDSRPVSPSAWSTNQFWMAHLAVTDIRRGELIAEERLTRGAIGLAGAEADPLRIWVEDWAVAGRLGSAEGRVEIEAQGERAGLDLELVPLKPAIGNGNRGLDPKGPEPGNASYYYSFPRIAVQGTVNVDGRTEAVEGLAWMDREWSTSALGPDLEGWDWFALQLSDGTDLMVYRLRRRDGTASDYSSGSLIDADGNRRPLGAEDFELVPLGHWTSPRSGARYPTSWAVRVPVADLDLEVRTYVEDQEIDLSVRYWEGAVSVDGRAGGRQVTGNGYLELAGY